MAAGSPRESHPRNKSVSYNVFQGINSPVSYQFVHRILLVPQIRLIAIWERGIEHYDYCEVRIFVGYPGGCLPPLKKENLSSLIWERFQFSSCWFLLLTLSDNQWLLCDKHPNDKYFAESLPGLSGGPCGALQSSLMWEIWLWLNVFHHFPSISHQQLMPQPFFYYGPYYTRKTSLQGEDRQTSPSHLLLCLPSPWKTYISLTCQEPSMEALFCCPISLTHLSSPVLISPAQTSTESLRANCQMGNKGNPVFSSWKHLLSSQIVFLTYREEKKKFPLNSRRLIWLFPSPLATFIDLENSGN